MSDDWRERFAATFPNAPHLVNGDDQKFDFSIRSIRLIGGAEIPLQQAGITAIVGANNAGKSTVLREAWEKLARHPHHRESHKIAVDSLDISTDGEQRDVIAWLGGSASLVTQEGSAGFQRSNAGLQGPQALLAGWDDPAAGLAELATYLAFYGDAQGRFGVGGAVEMRDNVDDPPVHPVHYLQDSRPLLEEVSSISREVFAKPLTLDSLGRTVRLRVGEVDMEAPRISDIPTEYRTKMASLRPLDKQGDGMRSMLGLLLPIITAAYKLIILDEPEAFLHPPQAHALGVQLGRIAESQNLQVVLATHDRNLLTGLLDSGAEVSVVRLSRDDGPASASRLDSDQLKELWTDPVLKYTNVLDGLFHRLVVVAEAEGDCAYLSAALDCKGRISDPLPRNEILMVPTGGKYGMAKVCAALSAVQVPTVAAPDLDMLSDRTKLKELVASLGEEWSEELDQLWNKATTDLNAKREPATVRQVLDAVNSALSPAGDEPFSSKHKKEALAQFRTSGSPWHDVQDYGMRAFKGEAYGAASELVRELDKRGVVVVKEGELEGLAPEITARKGPGWLQDALSAGQQCNAVTQAHVDRIVAAGQRR